MNTRKFIASVLGILVSTAMSASAGTFFDSLKEPTINTNWWTVVNTGNCTATPTSNGIVLTQGNSGTAGLEFNVSQPGDFDVTVDYSLLNYPSNNKERLGIVSGTSSAPPPPGSGVERGNTNSQGAINYYSTDITGTSDVITSVTTSDTNGELELTRVGNILSGYYLNSSSTWTLIDSSQFNSNTCNLFLDVWSRNLASPVSGVQVEFSNFSVTSASVPEPSTWAMLVVGVGALVGIRRWRRT